MKFYLKAVLVSTMIKAIFDFNFFGLDFTVKLTKFLFQLSTFACALEIFCLWLFVT